MVGRVLDIALDPHNPFILYVGLVHGGVFKTEDNGVTFDPIFDKQPVLSIDGRCRRAFRFQCDLGRNRRGE
jgi:hypothetical protein